MDKPEISLVVPTYNMVSHLVEQWQALRATGVLEALTEVVFVDDGSTDDTPQVLDAMRRETRDTEVKVVRLPVNSGRFDARLAGARASRGNFLLFLDARSQPGEGFKEALLRLCAQYDSIVGAVDIDTSRNVFCLYWQRSHELMFRRHYQASHKPIVLTPQNYDSFLKGTGVFVCTRERFLAACDKYAGTPLRSDDTYLMREIVHHVPMVVHPDLRIWWRPRETAWAFFQRCFDRGPGFVEYHVFERQGPYFYAVMAGLAGLGGLAALWTVSPPVGATATAGALAGLGLSTALMAKTPTEFFKLAPVHVGTVLAYGLGVLNGLRVNARDALRRRSLRIGAS